MVEYDRQVEESSSSTGSPGLAVAVKEEPAALPQPVMAGEGAVAEQLVVPEPEDMGLAPPMRAWSGDAQPPPTPPSSHAPDQGSPEDLEDAIDDGYGCANDEYGCPDDPYADDDGGLGVEVSSVPRCCVDLCL